MYQKIVIVLRKTRLQELVERFNTIGQARFYIEHAGGNFAAYVQEDDAYRRSLEIVQNSVDIDLKVQFIDREFLPTFVFTQEDIVMTLGQDGLVANTAKYVRNQPIIAMNPDPERFDGILLPFTPAEANSTLRKLLEGRASITPVTMAEASFQDGQRLLAFNDLFIGARTHVSARYNIRTGQIKEAQSSSGVIVSTGAGSTGWLSSVFNMARGVSQLSGGKPGQAVRMQMSDPRLVFVVREPFVSLHSQANVVAGMIEPKQELILESVMPSGGCVFSDGIESDFVEFNSGSTVHIKAAAQAAQLVVR